tara:strand:+ start:271 stop:450 length:180 start_codon:yes stop_codon:yes gene_type:complete
MLRAETIWKAAHFAGLAATTLAELLDDDDDDDGWLGDVNLVRRRLMSVQDDLEDLAADA